MYLRRDSEQRLENLARFFPVVAVSGARQVGKTTLRFLEVKWQEHPDQTDARSIRAVAADANASSVPIETGRHAVLGTPADSDTTLQQD